MLKLNIIDEEIEENWTIEKICNRYIPPSWDDVFSASKEELKIISQILEKQEKIFGQIYPLKKDIFNALYHTPLKSVNVVIIGQDPYHQSININGKVVPRATGLSFSVRREDIIPISLKNIYTELINSVRGFVQPEHGDLTEWAKQGVLMLNSCLTVNPNSPGSHGEIWSGFTKNIFKEIAKINPNCIYVLWGREAQKMKALIGEKSIILEAAHPSGLSARKGFFGCNHFNIINENLVKFNKKPITWTCENLEI